MRILSLLLLLALTGPAHATLYKCLDNAGKVTYTNLPCDKSGLKESSIIPPPPPPADTTAPAPQDKAPTAATPASRPVPKSNAKPAEAPAANSGVSVQLNTTQQAPGGKCARLDDTIGQVMDEMDEARRKGYTAQQEAAWNARIKKLQAEKNKLGCF